MPRVRQRSDDVKRIEDLTKRRIGTHGVASNVSVCDAAREFIAKEISALIVYEDHKMVGIFTKNDFIRCCIANPNGICDLTVGDGMKTNLFTTTLDADLDEVMAVMVEKGFRHVPVLDGDKPVGMVTETDILLRQNAELGHEKDHLVDYIQGSY